MTISPKCRFPQDEIIVKNFLRQQWRINAFFSTVKQQEMFLNYIFKNISDQAAEKYFVYDNNNLVGFVFLSFKFVKPQELLTNECFQRFFQLKKMVEESLLSNENILLINLFYAESTEVTNLLKEKIKQRLIFHKRTKVYFATVDSNIQFGKKIWELSLPIGKRNYKIKLQWFASKMQDDSADRKLGFGVYGNAIGDQYLYYEFFPSKKIGCDTTILLIHGLASDHNTWIEKIPFLRNFANVVTVDLPLHGQSNVSPLNAMNWNLPKMAFYLVDFLKKQKYKKLIIWGHSLGGGVAILLWFICQKIVRGLILEDAYNPGALHTRKNFIYGLIQAARNQFRYQKWQRESSLSLLNEIGVTKANSGNETNRVLNVYKPLNRKIFLFFNSLMETSSLIFSDFAYHQNKKLKTLVLFGENDFVVNRNLSQKYFNEELTPNYRFVTVPFANHSPHINNPKFTEAEVLNYLLEIMK